MRVRQTVLLPATVLALLLPAAQAAADFGPPMESGPGAAAIVQRFELVWSEDTGLREGNASFGRQHIANGGSTGNTSNHELTAAAKGLWLKAMDSVEKGSWTEPFKGGRLSTYKYSTGNGTKRTMCVLTDDNNYRYSGKDYGRKGIITAYWVNGHVGPGGCSKD
ncbi:hypothetical protein ACODT3_00645 [Streptomyces sp. 4.24]|uniref:hypothetical protein n=1 Tax=Streptomyces tritrimontium TaxID=3406573 RepID=UPI003BB4ECBD